MKQPFSIHKPVLFSLLFLTCNNSNQPFEDTAIESNCHQLKPGQKGFIQLVNSNEPGEPLIIYGKVMDSKTGQPVSNAALFLYQTDTAGIYSRTGPDENARIRGTVHTSASGCFKIKTILPGDYPGRKNSRHLHYVINTKGYKERKSILFFKGFTTENITGEGPLIVLDIQKDKTGTWVGSTDLRIEASDK
jgi:protocatechuate 3,4-dioxygenase beta subunit